MIDISISSLEGLRTKCATSNDLTQQEIRTLEVSSIRVENDNILRCILTTKINMGLSRLPVSLRGHGVHIVLGIFSLITCVNPWSTGGGNACVTVHFHVQAVYRGARQCFVQCNKSRRGSAVGRHPAGGRRRCSLHSALSQCSICEPRQGLASRVYNEQHPQDSSACAFLHTATAERAVLVY